MHYGVLAKEILKGCEEWVKICKGDGMRGLMDFMLKFLTGYDTSGSQQQDEGGSTNEPLLENVLMRMFELEIYLPKASLMGSGVSLKKGFGYAEGVHGPSAYSMVLCIKGLRVPTLVGVNPNERLAKQVVVVDVEVQRWEGGEGVAELEEVVVKVCLLVYFSLSSCFDFNLCSFLERYSEMK